MDFTYDEQQLMAIYYRGTREATIVALTEMKSYLGENDDDLRVITDSALDKLTRITDAEFDMLDLIPDFGEDGETDAG